MTTARHFLGWNAPPVNLLTTWLVERYEQNSLLDLSHLTIVLPSGNGVRLLQQQIVLAAAQQQLALLPPDITTIGGLPERLYPHKTPATAPFQQLAWRKVLIEANQQGNLDHFLNNPPPPSNVSAWQQLANLVASIHHEISGEGLRCSALAEYCQQQEFSYESIRWQQIEQLQQSYLQLLDQYQVWDLQTARLYALEHEELNVADDRTYIVAGCSDMSMVMRRFLTAIGTDTQFVVFAPEDKSTYFDEVGALIASKWDAGLPAITIDQIKLASDPVHQSELALDTIARYAPDVASNDIMLIVPDVAEQPGLARHLRRTGLQSNVPTGPRLTETSIGVLLQLIREYLPDRSYAGLSSLLRHPDISEQILDGLDVTQVIAELTAYHEEKLPRDDTGIEFRSKRYPELAAAFTKIWTWLEPLDRQHPAAASIHQNLLTLLHTVYGGKTYHRDTHLAEINTLTKITRSSDELASAYDQLGTRCSVEDYLAHLSSLLISETVPVPHSNDAIDLSGWLDAPWSQQGNVILTSVNEGIIPTVSNTDLFISDETRMALGLLNNQRRLARDAYALTLLQNSRDLTLISKKQNLQGDPQVLSRLLLHGPVKQQAELIHRFSGEHKTIAEHQASAPQPSSGFTPISLPIAAHQPESISVTSLKSYLECPVRYYLRFVLQLTPVNDYSHELTPLAFGNMVHHVLSQFGKSEVRDSIDEAEISIFLRDKAVRYYRDTYGKSSYATVRLQLEQILHRLDAFAAWQAKWRGQGWQIVEAEYNADTPVVIDPSHPNCKIHGRVDRIDHNPATSTYTIFDYKTSELASTPEKAHQSNRGGTWKDLQLPMYRHLCKAITKDSAVQLGYINLCSDLSELGSRIARWDEEALQEADSVAIEVITSIREGVVNQPGTDIRIEYDTYADLLGATTFDAPEIHVEEPRA